MIVRVATSNAMKVEATRKAFARFYKKVKVLGVEVASGVSAQPISFGEIVRGARERAKRAYADCDFAVGIEAGVFRVGPVSANVFQITMACVYDGTREALGGGPFYEVPKSLLREIAKADTGSVAIVTKGKVTRGQVTTSAVIMALAPFVSGELYR